MMIKRAETQDAGALAGQAAQMWTSRTADELVKEYRERIQKEDANRIICFRKPL